MQESREMEERSDCAAPHGCYSLTEEMDGT
jgi:hypothetical protein